MGDGDFLVISVLLVVRLTSLRLRASA